MDIDKETRERYMVDYDREGIESIWKEHSWSRESFDWHIENIGKREEISKKDKAEPELYTVTWSMLVVIQYLTNAFIDLKRVSSFTKFLTQQQIEKFRKSKERMEIFEILIERMKWIEEESNAVVKVIEG